MTDNRKALIAKIHIAKKQLCLDDGTYRDVLHNVTGKDSCSAMNVGELNQALKEFKRLGFKPTTQGKFGAKPATTDERKALIDKIEAQLSDLGLHWNYAHGLAKKMFGVDRVHWLHKDKLYKVVQALAVYQRRHRKQ